MYELGQVGDIDGNFCCLDSDLGTYGVNVCCSDGLKDAGDPSNRACCNGVPYNEDTHLCCDVSFFSND